MDREKELNDIFKDIDSNVKTLVTPLLKDVVFLENKMMELKRLPFIRINPKDTSQQKTTPAFKQYKECSQSYMNAIRILCSLLNKQDNSAENELLERLKGFSRL